MKAHILYAGKDQTLLEEMLGFLDLEAVPLGREAVNILQTASGWLFLFMSIDLLYPLICKEELSELLKIVRRFEGEEKLLIVPVRACDWPQSFLARVFLLARTC